MTVSHSVLCFTLRGRVLFYNVLGTQATVKCPYYAERDDELSLQKGDVLLIFEKYGNGWWRGMIGEREGWFPADILQGCTFVRTITPHSVLCCYIHWRLGHFLC